MAESILLVIPKQPVIVFNMQFVVYASLVLSLVTSSLAYLVKSPNDNEGWSSHRVGRVTWNRVNTDNKAFAVVLTRQQPPYNALISSYIDGGSPGQDHSSNIPPPPGGFPTGDHFRANLVDVDDHNTIYAQSNEFTIKN